MVWFYEFNLEPVLQCRLRHVIMAASLVDGELLPLPGALMSIAPCNKVCEVARRRTVMFDDGGMNDETSATV